MATYQEYQAELDRISGNVSDALAATAEMGADVPATANSDDLGTLIRSIPKGGGVDMDVAGADEALSVLAECGFIEPMYQDGVFYTDPDGKIYVY